MTATELLSYRIRALLGRHKTRYVRSLTEDLEGLFNANYHQSAYLAPKKLHSKPASCVSAAHAIDSCIMSDKDRQRAC